MIFKNDISNRIFWALIASLIVLRIVLVLFLVFDIPHTNLSQSVNLFDNDNTKELAIGDGELYFSIAGNLTNLKIEPDKSQISVGFPLYLAALMTITNAHDIFNLSRVAFIMLAVILYCGSIVFVCLIAKKLLGSNVSATFAGAIYVVYPYILYILNLGPYTENWGNFIDAMWLPGLLTDGLSAFLIYTGIYFSLAALTNRKSSHAVWSGVFTGAAALVRVTNLIFIAWLGLCLLFSKKIKKFFYFVCASMSVFLLQLYYNIQAHGSWLSFGGFNQTRSKDGLMKDDYYLYQTGTIAKLGFTTDNYFYFLTVLDKYIAHLPAVLILISIFVVLAFWYVFKRSKENFLILLLWILPYLAFYLSFHSSARNIRYWLPIVPAVIIVSIFGFKAIFEVLTSINYKFIKNVNRTSK